VTIDRVLSVGLPSLGRDGGNALSATAGNPAEKVSPQEEVAPERAKTTALRVVGRVQSRRTQPAQSGARNNFSLVDENMKEIQKHVDVIDEEEQERLCDYVKLLKSAETEKAELAAISDRLKELLRAKGREYHHGWRREDRDRRKSLLHSIQSLVLFAEARRTNNVELNRRLHFLGRGNKATVYSYRSQNGGRWAFKELPKSNWREDGWDAIANLVAHSLCNLLAARGAPCPMIQVFPAVVNGKIGLAMPIAPGKTLRKFPSDRAFWKSSSFRRQETWLQILDCIGGETDRYVRNVFWDEKTEALTAIDSDRSFSLSRECPTIRWNPVTKEGRPQQYCIPPVIDTDMRAVIEELSETELRKCLGEIGLFSEQIDAACTRLKALKRHNFYVITPNQWADDDLLREGGCTDTNCCFLLHWQQSLAIRKGLRVRRGEDYLTGTWPSGY
jgi:hypothetical protein